MKVHYGIGNVAAHNPVVTIGSFDGVHLGHACVIRHLRRKAAETGGESVIISFEPHPREVLYPMEKKPGILTTLDEKMEILERYGVDHLVIEPFTVEFARQSYADFVRDALVGRLRMRGLVVGYDHHFGKDREGNFESLQLLSRQYGFFLEQEQVFEEDDVNVSSTKIRNALAVGDVALVNRFLGYPYSFTGTVVAGQHLGNEIGFPTANIHLSPEKYPLKTGVYAVTAEIGGQTYRGIANYGSRPTFGDGRTVLEVYADGYAGDLYGQTITVYFDEFIREIRKFGSAEELSGQLKKDLEKIR